MSLKLEDVSFVYGAGTSSETKALNNVNLEINKGEFVAIIGHTGSGKSTLIQHFNGLEKATSGNVYYDGKNIHTVDGQTGKIYEWPHDYHNISAWCALV